MAAQQDKNAPRGVPNPMYAGHTPNTPVCLLREFCFVCKHT